MNLTTIGTGTAAPERDRVASGQLIETGDLRLLVDCGPGVLHAMAGQGVDWTSITHVLVTHFHNDHIGDIPALFFAWKHGMRPARQAPLHVFGPAGMKRKIDAMADLFGSHLSDPPFALEVTELEGGEEVRLSDVAMLRCIRTPHTETSLAYRIEADARSVCCTGDTGFSADVARFALSVDLLLIECSVPDEEPMPTHLTPSEVAAMARIALPRELVVTHCYPQLDRALVPELVRRGGWPARVQVARDGQVFRV